MFYVGIISQICLRKWLALWIEEQYMCCLWTVLVILHLPAPILLIFLRRLIHGHYISHTHLLVGFQLSRSMASECKKGFHITSLSISVHHQDCSFLWCRLSPSTPTHIGILYWFSSLLSLVPQRFDCILPLPVSRCHIIPMYSLICPYLWTLIEISSFESSEVSDIFF